MSEDKRITRRELFKMTSPMGSVKIESDRCTGCGICADGCPTDALAIETDGASCTFELLFRHGACIACSECAEICPENCIVIERVMELDRLKDPAEVLFHDEIVLCEECGKPVGPRSMLERISSRLGDAAKDTQFSLCPECKGRNFLRAS